MFADRKSFSEKWKNKRKAGFVKYYSSHISGLLVMALVMIIADYLGTKSIHMESVIIVPTVLLLYPAVAWSINEVRYKSSQKKHD